MTKISELATLLGELGMTPNRINEIIDELQGPVPALFEVPAVQITRESILRGDHDAASLSLTRAGHQTAHAIAHAILKEWATLWGHREGMALTAPRRRAWTQMAHDGLKASHILKAVLGMAHDTGPADRDDAHELHLVARGAPRFIMLFEQAGSTPPRWGAAVAKRRKEDQAPVVASIKQPTLAPTHQGQPFVPGLRDPREALHWSSVPSDPPAHWWATRTITGGRRDLWDQIYYALETLRLKNVEEHARVSAVEPSDENDRFVSGEMLRLHLDWIQAETRKAPKKNPGAARVRR